MQAAIGEALVSYNDLDATLTGRIIYSLTPTPSFEYDTPVSNYFSRKIEASFARCDEWFYVICASVRLRQFMGIFPPKARLPANFTSVRKIFLIRPV